MCGKVRFFRMPIFNKIFEIMKNILTAFSLLFLLHTAYGQTVANSFNGSPFAEAYDINGKPFTSTNNTNIDGTPMLSESWGKGFVKLKNGKQLAVDALQFNLFDNELHFKKDNTEFIFADAVSEFKISYTQDDLDINAVFRNGYPDMGKNTGATFYQVLADGNKLQLLKYSAKSIQDNYSYGGPVRKIYKETNEYFVYDIKNAAIKSISLEKASLIRAAPDFESSINQFKSKLRSEKEMTAVFNLLNTQ